MNKRFIFPIIIIVMFTTMISHAENSDVSIHGFLSQGYLKSNHNNFYANTEDGTFEFNEMGINFGKGVTEKLHLGIQFFARDLGKIDNDKITVSWAYGDYRFKDYLGIRAGIMKLSYGLYNEIRDMDVLRPNILYPGGIYNESWRNMLSAIKGVGIYGNFNLGAMGKIKYIAQNGVINIGVDSSSSKFIENQSSVFYPGATADVLSTNVNHAYSGKLFTQEPFSVKGLKIGISSIDIKFDNVVNFSSAIYTADIPASVHATLLMPSIEFTKNNYTLSAEYMKMDLDFGLPDALSLISPDLTTSYSAHSWYISFSYSFTDWLETYICYSKYNNNDSDKDGDMYAKDNQQFARWLDEIILAIRFDINNNWICKFETHFIDGTTCLFDEDQDEPVIKDGTPIYPYKRDWILFAVKLSYNF